MHLIHRYDLLNGVALVPNSSPIGSTHVLRLLNSQLDFKHVLAGIGFKHLHFSYETRQATRLHLLSIALRSLLCWCFLLRNPGILRTTMMKYPRCMDHPQLYNFLIFLNYMEICKLKCTSKSGVSAIFLKWWLWSHPL